MAKKTLNEKPIDYGQGPERMSPDIERKLRAGEHPLAGNPAFPDVDGDGVPDTFEELIASKRFKDVIQKVKDATGLERVDPQSAMSLQPMFQEAIMKTLQIEGQHKEALERLAVKLVRNEMGVSEEDLQFDAKLEKPGLEGMQSQPQKPKEKKKQEFDLSNPEAEQEAAMELEKFNLERQKRRFINSLIQGSSKKALYMYHLIREELDEINPELVNLYSLLMSVNNLMYWIMPDMDDKMSGGGGEEMGAGREELDLETDPPTIKATGVFFPVLVHELYKGVMEYVSAHGLPSDPGTAEAVIGMEDTLPAEVWDLRLGPVIWEKFTDAYPYHLMSNEDNRRIQNYLYFHIVSLEAEEFLSLAKEMLSGSPKGKAMVEKIVNDIVEQLKKEDYEDVSGEDMSSSEERPSDIPGFEGTMDSLDDLLDLSPRKSPEEEPKAVESPIEYDLDTILDKISKGGMESLTAGEKKFLIDYSNR